MRFMKQSKAIEYVELNRHIYKVFKSKNVCCLFNARPIPALMRMQANR